jgi:hypothetical protein
VKLGGKQPGLLEITLQVEDALDAIEVDALFL